MLRSQTRIAGVICAPSPFVFFVIRPDDSLPLLAETCSLIFSECNVVLAA